MPSRVGPGGLGPGRRTKGSSKGGSYGALTQQAGRARALGAMTPGRTKGRTAGGYGPLTQGAGRARTLGAMKKAPAKRRGY